MAWHAAKRVLALIAVSSYVRVLLTGGIYDTEDKAAGLRFYDSNLGSIQNAFPLCTPHANNEKDTDENSIHSVESLLETHVKLHIQF